MWFQEKRTIAALPVVTVDDTQNAGEYRRIQGGGGNNYSGGTGVLVEHAGDGTVNTQGNVLEAITEDQQQY